MLCLPFFCCQCSKHKRSDKPDSNYKKDTHDATYRGEPHGSTYRRDPPDSSYRQDRSSRHDPRNSNYRRDQQDSTTYRHDAHDSTYKRAAHDSPYKQDTYDPTYKRDSYRLHPHDTSYRPHKTAFRRDKNDGAYWQEIRESEYSINPTFRPGLPDSHYRHEPYDSPSRHRKTSYKHDAQGYYNYGAQPNGAFTAKESSSNDSVTSGRKAYTQGVGYKRSTRDTHDYRWERQDARYTPTQYSDSQGPSSSRHTTDIDDTQEHYYNRNERSTQGPSHQQKTTIEHSIANTPTTCRLVCEDRPNYRWETKHNNSQSDDRCDPNDYNYSRNSQTATYVEKEPLSSPGPNNKPAVRTSSRNNYRGDATPDSGYKSDKPNMAAKRDVRVSSGSDEIDDAQPVYRDTFDSGYKADNEGRVNSRDTSAHRHVNHDTGCINEEQTADTDELRDEMIRQEARKNRHKYTAKSKTPSSQRQENRDWMLRHRYFNSMLRRIQRFPA